jgi:hypothetical protein
MRLARLRYVSTITARSLRGGELSGKNGKSRERLSAPSLRENFPALIRDALYQFRRIAACEVCCGFEGIAGGSQCFA